MVKKIAGTGEKMYICGIKKTFDELGGNHINELHKEVI